MVANIQVQIALVLVTAVASPDMRHFVATGAHAVAHSVHAAAKRVGKVVKNAKSK